MIFAVVAERIPGPIRHGLIIKSTRINALYTSPEFENNPSLAF
jgi:hypothetical protein